MYVVDVGGFCHFCVVSISIQFFFARSYKLGGASACAMRYYMPLTNIKGGNKKPPRVGRDHPSSIIPLACA